MGKPSRDKGQRGEREFQATIQGMGINSRRLYTAQAVGLGVPDLITENQAGAISWEVKRTKLLRWSEWQKQLEEQRKAMPGTVTRLAFKLDRMPWMTVGYLEDDPLYARILRMYQSEG